MKKALAFLLALCMLLTLCACADVGEKEFEAAKALYDAGDYENAIEALQNVGHYAEITNMIADAQKQLAAESYGFLFTTWKDVRADGTNTVIFQADGTCDLDGSPMQYSMGNGKVTVAGIFTLDITQEDGIYHLAGDGTDYIREEDYDQFIAEHTVELTLDNYLDYYEWVESRWEKKDAYGNIYSVQLDYELMLKKEYQERVSESLSSIEMGYTYKSTKTTGWNMQIDFETLEYSGGSASTDTISRTGDCVLLPASYTEGFALSDDELDIADVVSEVEIIRVEGHLVIR